MSRDLTASEARSQLFRFRTEMGEQAEAMIMVSGGKWSTEKTDPLQLSVHPRGYAANGRDEQFTVSADTFRDLLAKAREKWATMSDEYARRTVRKMALEIIRITADIGECSDSALRQAGFSEAEVRTHGERACADANEIAANGPFSIATMGGANNVGEAA